MKPIGNFPDQIDGLPNICGLEGNLKELVNSAADNPVFLNDSRISFHRIKSACAIAIHMHQPLIPAGGGDLRTAAIISNLQHMMNNQGIGDNHNAPVFQWCYKRMGDFIPQYVGEGKQPRVMLEYSGTLLWGFQQMGLGDVIDNLKRITMDHNYRNYVEWLGAPGACCCPVSTSSGLQASCSCMAASFAAMFGPEALERVRGFSPQKWLFQTIPMSPMNISKHLEIAGTDGFVQEHTIENPLDGYGPQLKHLPHRLVWEFQR